MLSLIKSQHREVEINFSFQHHVNRHINKKKCLSCSNKNYIIGYRHANEVCGDQEQKGAENDD